MKSTETRSPLIEVEKFTTQIWQHPLLTQQTQRNRMLGKSYLEERYQNQEGLLFIPVGSCIWISDEESDVDYVRLHKPQLLPSIIEQTVVDINEAHHNPVDGMPSLHLASYYPIPSQLNFEEHFPYLSLLYMTPDEYIVGDHNWLHNLRIQALDQRNYDGQETRHIFDFSGAISATIKEKFFKLKSWPGKHFAQEYATHYPRFMNALAMRSQASNFPDTYPQEFYEQLTSLKPPLHETYHRAMQQSGGRLHLQPRYAARGITK